MMISKKVKKTKTRNNGCGLLCWVLLGFYFFTSLINLSGQDSETIASGEITVKGVRLQVDPVQQTVPINMETVVNTVFSAESPEMLEGMVVKGTLRGPGINGSILLTTLPNHPFSIPGFTSKGTYTLADIHLEKDGNVLLTAEPAEAVIEAMDIIVTRVETRPLTLEEIREKGINITDRNFTVFNFSVGILVESQEVRYEFPVVYSGQQPYIPTQGGMAELTPVKDPVGREKVPFMLELPELELPSTGMGATGEVPKIPGVLIFNNDIAFLNQFFSVMFIISNHATEGSNITLKNLTAKITYPQELREAETTPPHIAGTPIPVRCPGPDGKIGTADDLDIILATFSGMAEFLAEGLKEGTHIVEVDFEGTLSGLPSGDTPVKGKASGAVIVRNPEFSVTFAHPGVVRIGEEYDIHVSLVNTSPVAANLVSLTMPSSQLIGTRLLSEETASFETIAPGESVTALFHMLSLETGRVRAAAMEVEGSVKGKFVLTAGVGEKDIPLSPDTLVLPDYTYLLPHDIINTAMVALGEAYSIATTPPGGLPEGIPAISTEVVKQRVIDLAEAGQRIGYGDTTLESIKVLALDWIGNRFQDISFDILRRMTSKGIKFAEAQAAIFNENLNTNSPADFQESYAETCSYKNPFFSAILSFGGSRSARLKVVDYYQNQLTCIGSELVRDIPYGELYLLEDGNQNPVDFALIGHADEHGYTIEVIGVETGTFDLSLIVPSVPSVPSADNGLNQVVFSGVPCEPGSRSYISVKAGDSAFTLSTEQPGGGDIITYPGSVQPILEPLLQLISATQDCTVDSAGHVAALFFNRTVSQETAKDKTNFSSEGKEIYASFLQPSGRVILVGMNNPISPFVESRIKVENLEDTKGRLMSPSPDEKPITATIKTPGGIVYGRVLTAEGQPVSGAMVRLLEYEEGELSGFGNAGTTYSFDRTDTSGNYQFDFVRILSKSFVIEVVDPNTDKREKVSSKLRVNGQRLQLDIIMRGRGTVTGQVIKVDGTPAAEALVQATAENAAFGEYYSAQCNENGEFQLADVPLGRFSLIAALGSQRGFANTSLNSPGEIQHVTIPLTQKPTGNVNGRVLQADGITTVEDTVVSLSQEGIYLGYTRTDADGFYEFSHVPVGTVTIQALNPITLRFDRTVSGQVTSGQTFTVNIIFRGTGIISGKVMTGDGPPLIGAVVYIPNTPFHTETNSSGEFLLADIPMGTYTVQAYDKNTFQQTGASATLYYEGQETRINLVFSLQQKGSISGLVKDVDGTPLPDVDVLVSDGNYIVVAALRSNANGQYNVNDLIPGNYKVTIVKSGYAGVANAVVKQLQITTADVQLRGKGKINVNVVNADAIGTMADVTLTHSMFEFNPSNYIGFRGMDSTYTTDENGHLEIDDIFIGGFSVIAKNAFYPQGAYKSGTLANQGETVTIDLVMKGTGSVTVTVVSPDGQTLVPNASLKFTPTGLPTQQGIFTGSDPNDIENYGKFTFNLVPAGTFYIEARDQVNDFVGDLYGFMGYEGGTMEVTLRLKGKGQVNVTVKDFEGNVIQDFNGIVTLKNVSYPFESYPGTKGPDGRFVFSNVNEGEFSVSAYDNSTDVGGRANGKISAHNEEVNIDVVLDAWGTIYGKVLTPDNNTVVPNASVILYSNTSGEALGYFTSDSEGGFRFEYVPMGSFRIEVFDPGSGRKGKSYCSLETGGEEVEIDVRFEGRGRVSGTFFNGSRVEPIAHAQVKIKSSGAFPFETVTNTDAEGNFTFDQIGEGQFSLSAEDPATHLVGMAEGEIQYDDHHVFINIYGQPTGTVKGTVFHAGGQQPAANASIWINNKQTAVAYANENGYYSVQYVTMGSFTVTAKKDRDSGTASGTLVYHGQEAEKNIILNGLGKITGHVLDGTNPVSDVTVNLTSGNEPFSAVTGGDGSFTFADIRPGPFSIQAKDSYGLSAAASGVLELGVPELTIDLVLESAGTVKGMVFNTDGTTPAQNAYVTLKWSNSNRYAVTDTNGYFEFHAVKVGDFTVDVQGLNNTGKARGSGRINNNGDILDFDNLVLDNTKPQVVTITPADGSNNLPVNTNIVIVFSEAMTPASITDTTIRLTSNQGAISITPVLEADGKTVDIAGLSLNSFMLYTLTVTTSVEDAAGNTVETAVSSSFTTLDTQPPLVVSTTPTNGQTGILPNTAITVTFNEPVNKSTFTSQNLVVKKGETFNSGINISGAITFNENSTCATFTPSNLLEENTRYWIWANNQADIVGNIQSQEFLSSFRTIDTIAPVLESLTAPGGTTVVEGSPITVVAAASAADIAGVHFYINGEFKTTVTSGSSGNYSYQFTAPLISQVGGTFLVEALAVDQTGNQSNKANLTFTLQPDSPPQIILTGPPDPAVFPGSTFNCSVSASDDIQLTRVTVTAVGGSLNEVKTENISQSTFSNNYTFTMPTDILPGTNILLHAEAEDLRGNVSSAADMTLQVPQDNLYPVVNITTPSEGAHFKYNEVVTIEAEASDDVGLKAVRIFLDDQLLATHTNKQTPYTATYTVPLLEQEHQAVVKVEAEDLTGKVSQDTVNIVLEKLEDLSAPQVKIITPSNGTLVFAGENLKIKIDATDSEGVEQVEIYVDDQLFQTLNQPPYELDYPIPANATAGSTITIKAIATDVSEKTATDQSILEVVTGTFIPAGTVIKANNPGYDNQTIIINDGTVTINGDHAFVNILVKETGHLTHSGADTADEYNMVLTVSGKVVIGPDARIDVSTRGYMGARQIVNGLTNTSDYGLTTGNQPGSYYQSGGSYGGYGGQYSSYTVNGVYGSPYAPMEAGSGGGGYMGNPGGSGGGVIRVQAGELVLDGQLFANGGSTSNYGAGGSGGAIYLNLTTLNGSGHIQANGGSSTYSSGGGGGRIAIYYQSAAKYDLSTITAWGGELTSGGTAQNNGSAGTIYLEKTGQPGQLIIKNNPDIETLKGTQLETTSPGTITGLGPGKLTDANADFIANSLKGMLLQPNINDPKTFIIISNNDKEIMVDYQPGDDLLEYAQVGDSYRVKHRGNVILEDSFAHIKGNASVANITLDNATLVVDGTLEAEQLTLQSGSRITHSPTVLGTTFSLVVTADELTISEGCSIDVDGYGYPGAFDKDKGNKTGTTGVTFPNTLENGSKTYGGGSYGGYGGRRFLSETYEINKPYGSITDPQYPGSGGGGEGINYPGTSGGGIIKIQAETLTLNGTVTGNGISSTDWSGTGSGGSIWIDVGTITGSGIIQANGGSSYLQCGAGSGGRIALYYGNSNEFDFNNITAYGGLSGTGTDWRRNGSSGTIYLKKNDETPQLIIANRSLESYTPLIFPVIEAAEITSISGNVLENSNGDYMPGSLVGMRLIPNIDNPENTYTITDNSRTTITVDMDIINAQVGDTYKGMMVFPGDVKIMTALSEIGGDVELGSLTLTGNSVLRHPQSTTISTSYLFITVDAVTIDAGSSINVDGCGYLGAFQSDNNTNTGMTYPNTITNGSGKYNGGSYGGMGGKYTSQTINDTYGSLYAPFLPGSGGGGESTNFCGTNGGGVIRINTNELINNGTISSNGQSTTDWGGAGSGGSIWLQVDTLRGTGSIQANGGNSSYVGAGGGGRIALYYENATEYDLSKITAYGGLYADGTNAIGNGGAGTIYLKQSSVTGGNLTVDNNNVPTGEDSTPLPAVGQGFNTLLEANRLFNSSGLFIPGSLIGIKLNPHPTGNTVFTITNNNQTEIFTDPADGDMTQVGISGGAYIGEHHLFNVTVKGSAQLFTLDRIQVSGTLTVAPGSVLKAENHQ
jgi:hypothetical protein